MPYSLTSWLKAHLSTLYECPSNAREKDFQESFDLTFSSNAQIIFNHRPFTCDELKQDIRKRSFAAMTTSTEWKDIVELEQPQGSKVRTRFRRRIGLTLTSVSGRNRSRLLHRYAWSQF